MTAIGKAGVVTLLRTALILVIGSWIVFVAVRVIPGDGIALRSRYADAGRAAAIRSELGLDRPYLSQYIAMIGDFFSGDWGRSMVTGRPVAGEFFRRFGATFELICGGIVVGTFIGIGVVFIADGFRSRLARGIPRIVAEVGLVVPLFWLGLIGIYTGGHLLGIFPMGGRAQVGADTGAGFTGLLTLDSLLRGDIAAFIAALHYLVLPVAVLSLFPAAVVASILQARLEDDRTATLRIALVAKGVGPVRLRMVHLLRLCAPVLVAALGTQFGALLGGAVITETVFSWPGVGSYLIQGVLNRDLFLVQNSLLFLLLAIALVLALSDILTRWLGGPSDATV